MKVSGFTVIRNAELMGYPVRASLLSLLPLVDELIVGVGQSEDRTRTIVEDLNDPKIKIFDSVWDTNKTSGGFILSEKTNEALARCQHDWCFYLQADEVLHEQDLARIHESMVQHFSNDRVQGLLFRYLHFYGSYDVIATNRKWYRNEVRVIKKSSGATSFRDAQGFRVGDQKLSVKPSGGSVYHYGWVKPPEQMGQKTKLLNFWWHGNKKDHEVSNFKYVKQYGLKRFLGVHPKVMDQLIAEQSWNFDIHRDLKDWTIRDVNLLLSDLVESVTGHRIGEYKPYRII